MGLFSFFTKKEIPEKLKTVRLKPIPFNLGGTKAFPLFATAVRNKELQSKNPIKWIQHTQESEQTKLVGYIKDGIYKIVDIEINKVGTFYKVLPQEKEGTDGVWVAKEDIYEIDNN